MDPTTHSSIVKVCSVLNVWLNIEPTTHRTHSLISIIELDNRKLISDLKNQFFPYGTLVTLGFISPLRQYINL